MGKYFGGKLPPIGEHETFGEYSKRHNLPHIYVPFFPYGVEQVGWQVELQRKFPTVSFYPYEGLQVSKGNEMVFVIFENEEQITDLARVAIVQRCCDYGEEHAEKTVPSVERLREMYRIAKEQQ